jgi:hypothetical protein
MNKKVLTKQIAEKLADSGEYDFSEFTEIDPAAAVYLVSLGQNMDLSGLTLLSDSMAALFSSHTGYLMLAGLETLSDDAAESLSQKEGAIILPSITSLSANAFISLSHLKGALVLSGLNNLKDTDAAALANHSGYLDLSGLTTLSDKAAEFLSQKGGYLDLSGLLDLTDAAASALSKTKDDLILSGLTSLNENAAEFLSCKKGDIDLSGLFSISDAVADFLSKHEGDMDLSGLNKLSDGAAHSLSNHLGKLFLQGLTTVNDEDSASLSTKGMDALLSGRCSIVVCDDLKDIYRITRRLKKPELFLSPPRSSVFLDEFKDFRAQIAQSFPLISQNQEERFLSRIRQDKDDFSMHLKSIKENGMCLENSNLLLSHFKNPISADWSIYIVLDSYGEWLIKDMSSFGCIERSTINEIENAFLKMGAAYSNYCCNYEDSLFNGSPPTWLYDFLSDADDPCMLELISLYDVPGDVTDVGVYLNEAGILGAGPTIGDKWTNYAVVAPEICDFMNRCLFPKFVAMLIDNDHNMGGTFVVIPKENINFFVKTLRKLSKTEGCTE